MKKRLNWQGLILFRVIAFITAGMILVFAGQAVAVTGWSVNVKDFGPAGNGNASADTAAFQAALDYMVTNFPAPSKENAGVSLYIPNGTYLITNRLSFVSTDAHPAFDQGIVIRGQSAQNTRIVSSSPTGLFYFKLAADRDLIKTVLQIEDIWLQAAVPGAGPAIEVATQQASATDSAVRVSSFLRNVTIGRNVTANYFIYGFKGQYQLSPIMDSVTFNGALAGSLAAFYFEDSYAYLVKFCKINGADVAVDAPYSAEENEVYSSVITNVNIGIRMNVDPARTAGPSSQGGAVLNSWISARKTGISMDRKDCFFIGNNLFSRTGNEAYTNIYLSNISKCIVSDNQFADGANQAGVVLVQDSSQGRTNGAYLATHVTVAYNTFGGSINPVVRVDTNVFNTMILDNANSTNKVVNAGINTYASYGTPRAAVDCPASLMVTDPAPVFAWAALTGAVGNVVNVKDFGAVGDGLTDDTQFITNAAASLVSKLNSSANGVLYFPAGTYKLLKQVDLKQPQGVNWQRIALIGDGLAATKIKSAATTSSVFSITCLNQAEVSIWNMTLEANRTNPAAAVVVSQPPPTVPPDATTPRSLIMQNVEISHRSGMYFKTAIAGAGLVRPLFYHVKTDCALGVPLSTGLLLTGGYGAEIEDSGFKFFQTDLNITTSLGGTTMVRGPCVTGGQENSLTNVINAAGGSVAWEHAHLNVLNAGLKIINASGVWFMRTETLNVDTNNTTSGRRTLHFIGDTDIVVRDNIFHQGPDGNPNRKCIRFEFGANRNADISGNMFKEAGTGIYISSGTDGVLIDDNRFLNPAINPLISDYGINTVINLLPSEF